MTPITAAITTIEPASARKTARCSHHNYKTTVVKIVAIAMTKIWRQPNRKWMLMPHLLNALFYYKFFVAYLLFLCFSVIAPLKTETSTLAATV
jgi:hypothetical protein